MATPASAHPHVWIDMRVTALLDDSRRLTALRINWTFDEFYTAFALDGLKKNAKGEYDPAALADLARVNLTDLAAYSYFTHIFAGNSELAPAPPRDGKSSYKNGQLTLDFVLPLKTPQATPVSFRIYDPTYYIAIDYVKPDPVSIDYGDIKSDALSPTQTQKCKIDISQKNPEKVFLSLPESYFTSAKAGNLGEAFAANATLACAATGTGAE